MAGVTLWKGTRSWNEGQHTGAGEREGKGKEDRGQSERVRRSPQNKSLR